MLEYAQMTPRPFQLVTAPNTQFPKLYDLMYWRYYLRQGSQCTYNVTLKRFRTTIVAVEKQYVLHIVSVCVSACVALVPARNAHAPYCNLWPVQLYNILPHYLINSTIFEKVLQSIKCVFWSSLWLLSEIFLHYKKNWARYDQKCMLVFT